MNIKRTFALYSLLFLIALARPVTAQNLDDGTLTQIDPRLAQFVANTKSEIKQTIVAIRDKSRSESDRVQLIQDLGVRFGDAGLPVARSVAAEVKLEARLSVIALRVLGNSVTMRPRPVATSNDNDAVRVWERRREFVFAAMRDAVRDKRDEVRRTAAGFLASSGDQAGLDAMVDAARQGRITNTEAANYIGLAPPEQRIKYLKPFLGGKDPNAEATAVTYLGSLPSSQPMIRNMYAENPNADPIARKAAIEVLGRTDPGFENYAADLMPKLQNNQELIDSVMKAYGIKLSKYRRASQYLIVNRSLKRLDFHRNAGNIGTLDYNTLQKKFLKLRPKS